MIFVSNFLEHLNIYILDILLLKSVTKISHCNKHCKLYFHIHFSLLPLQIPFVQCGKVFSYKHTWNLHPFVIL